MAISARQSSTMQSTAATKRDGRVCVNASRALQVTARHNRWPRMPTRVPQVEVSNYCVQHRTQHPADTGTRVCAREQFRRQLILIRSS